MSLLSRLKKAFAAFVEAPVAAPIEAPRPKVELEPRLQKLVDDFRKAVKATGAAQNFRGGFTIEENGEKKDKEFTSPAEMEAYIRRAEDGEIKILV